MLEVADLAIYISGGTALAVVGYAVKITWQLSRVEKSVREDLQREITRLEQEARERSDTYRNEFGETCAAIRQKIHDVEVFSRDHFVSKDSFESVFGRIERSFEKMTERLEGKLEKAVEIFHQRPDQPR
jgi:hypothetical protein